MTDNAVVRGYSNVFRHVEWNIGIVDDPISSFLKPKIKPTIHWLPPPKSNTFLADPFAISKDCGSYIFCEEFDYHMHRGRIVCLEIRNRRTTTLTPVMELPSHMSYPYLLEEKGEIYCVPETAQTGEIALYKAEKFPQKWKKAAILVNFPGVDSTIFRYHDDWWLTSAESTSVTHDYPTYRLFAWYAKELAGPWIPHPGNPVKENAFSSRPAGTPFMHDGFLYRPAQDLSRTYGGRIVLNRVLRLTATEFEEEMATVIEPDPSGPYPDGLHTISAFGNMTVVDGKRIKFSVSAFRRELSLNLQKWFQQAGTRFGGSSIA